MNPIKVIAGACAFVFLMILISSTYVIQQGSSGIKLRLGRMVESSETKRAVVYNPGLHLKWPFIEQVRVFDTRLQTLDIQSSRIVTKEKKDVIVDYFVKWRIENLARYFTSTSGNQLKAETLLEQQLNTTLRAAFGRRTISDLVSNERDDVMLVLRNKAEAQAGELGIHVVDVRIKGIELPPNTSNAIYQRMRADMKKIANKHRADGQAEAASLRAQADAAVTVIMATANSDAQRVRAEGQQQAAEMVVKSFGKNRAFYTYFQSLQAYKNSFKSKQDVMVLDLNSAFFDYFKKPLEKG